MWVWPLGWEDPLEEVKATHPTTLAWRLPWTEESGGLQSMGWQRVRHYWGNLVCTTPKPAINLFNNAAAAAAAKSLQSCPTLCDPIDGSPPGSCVPGILQARILEWVAISFSNACMHAKLLQSHPILCDPMDSRPPGSPVQGILQARVLEWVAISFPKTNNK